MRFTKMEGIGNDYVYINGFEEKLPGDLPALSVRMSRQHFGCGSDGLIVILPSEQADFRMRMFNNDGSESEMCGNGIRCVAKYCHDRGLTDKTAFDIESGGRARHVVCHLKDDKVESVRVDMGEPELDGAKIPSVFKGKPVIGQPLEACDRIWPATLVSMGNPHAVTFVDSLDGSIENVGRTLEHHPGFPRKCNVEFVKVKDRSHAEMRVWERGTGETLACGTGACAAMVACVLGERTDREIEMTLPGGKLRLEWSGSDNHVYMTGPARFVYDGVWLGDEDR